MFQSLFRYFKNISIVTFINRVVIEARRIGRRVHVNHTVRRVGSSLEWSATAIIAGRRHEMVTTVGNDELMLIDDVLTHKLILLKDLVVRVKDVVFDLQLTVFKTELSW